MLSTIWFNFVIISDGIELLFWILAGEAKYV